MRKGEFCRCLEALRSFGDWERKMYDCGMNIEGTPVASLAEHFHAAMCDFDFNWSYDSKLGLDWIIEWSYGDSPHFIQHRHNREWHLDTAGLLYDFLMFMNEHGWEDE